MRHVSSCLLRKLSLTCFVEKFTELIQIVQTLRSPRGCPWDRAQDANSLLPYFVEELYEFIAAVDQKNPSEIRKELGDLFLHAVFQGVLAEEGDQFTIEESLSSIIEKLIARHPHVFGNLQLDSNEDINHFWENQKHREGRKSVLEGIPKALPALHRALRIQDKAAAVGFDWDNIQDVWAKIHEETDEMEAASNEKDPNALEEELGDLLFSIVNVSRHLNINPENALRKANDKFITRFQMIEAKLEKQNRKMENCTLNELDHIWNEIKNKSKKEREE
jgi:MazG family protein